MMVWGMWGELPWPLRPPHRAPRPNFNVWLLHGWKAEGDAGVARWGDGRKTDLQQRPNFCPTCRKPFFNSTEAQLTPPPRPSSGARPTSLAFGRGAYGRETAQSCRPSKTSRRSSRTRWTRWTRWRQSHAHRKCSVGLELLLGKDDGQPDVWDAGAYEGLCGECGELINYQFHDQSLFVFLLLDAIEGAINFGTLCTVYMHIWACYHYKCGYGGYTK